MKHILGSLLIFLCFGFFSLQTVGASPSSPDYGESIPGGPSAGVYTLTGTLNSNELGRIYISATGASRGLFYDKNSYGLTGSIYSTGIGLIEITSLNNPSFVSGVKVCDGQDLASITVDCNITGSGGGVITLYSPAIGTLTGSVSGKVDSFTKEIKNLTFTNIGFGTPILSLSGINLVPKATNLTGGDFGTGVYYTNHSGSIQIFNDGTLSSNTKSIRLTPTTLSGSITNIIKDYSTTTDTFIGVDISIAGNYLYEMNIDGVISRGLIKVIASEVGTTLYSTSTTFFKQYCFDNKTDTSTNYQSTCPEKDSLKASKVKSDSSIKQANNNDKNPIILSLRDQYGNRISSIPLYLAIDVKRTLKNGQLLKIDIPNELRGITPVALPGLDGLRIPQSDWSGTTSSPINYPDYAMESDKDLLIELFSSASGSLQVEWKAKTRNIFGGSSTDIGSETTLSTGDITFEGLIKTNSFIISPTNPILRNRESVFSHQYTISDSGSIVNPHLEYIITTSSGEIVDRIRSIATNTCEGYTNTGGTSKPTDDCKARNETTVDHLDTLFGTDIPKTNSGTIDIGLTFATGAMTSTGTNTGYLIVMASYDIVGVGTIRYPLVKQPFNTAESTGTIPLKILGQIGSSDLGTSIKSLDLLSSNLLNTERDKIRKQAQMMRQNFVNHPLIVGSLTDIPNQVYIVEGDIYINADIWPPTPQKPKVLIALKKSDGTGGNIWINPSVKDIIASLIADGSIFSGTGPSSYHTPATTDNQLYILGSIMSNNTIGGFGLGRCPRNAIGCTEGGSGNSGNYDFEKMRGFDNTDSSKKSSGTTETASFVIEHDPRLVRDSPLVLMRDLTR
ncbi:MAG: hypothetical protein U0518_05405 [Candidatus Gracilibacteria bacterium]